MRFAAHVERHVHVDEIEPFLPRGIAHSDIAIPGQEKWRTKNGTIRKTVTHPSGYRKSLEKAYLAFGGKKYGKFEEMVRDKSAWKFFVSVKGTRRAMKRLLVKRFIIQALRCNLPTSIRP